ncbi:unnamed protein product [Chondrus crispus]|uniref:WW domain-containing protein n=1 Tax=Chondrus crispus TaxID=2769 RepID=R7QSQ1_CHOCR|nr:unnamed protein product [Chondrus crispus]CDF41169.1 unnamed protein product [Chondrus crispus]|eukprot:XP_005711463.1 unnamed protein product [Chondrus crispus]
MRAAAQAPARAPVHAASVPPSLPAPRVPAADWARATAKDGRPYWYSLSTGETSWEDPSSAAPQAAAAPPAKEHISPWRETRAEDGRVYYYNTETKKTQWERPADMPGVTAAKEKADEKGEEPQPLPEGWAQNSAADGRVYYYHAATRETRWDRPTVSAEVSRKRTASEITPVSTPTVDDWREHTAPDGRTYYYNAKTRETSWTKPAGHGASGERKRPRVDRQPVTDLREAIARSRERKDGKSKAEKKGDHVTRRPRSQEGKTLTDHQAETYFLNRAKIRKQSSGGKEDTDGGKAPELMQLETYEQRENVFFEFLRERGINEKSTWLETMSRCAGDPRYTVIEQYGFRKHAWLKWTQKCAKQARRQSILKTRAKSEALLTLMEEVFAKEPIATVKLEHCDPEKVRVFELDERFRAVDERQRSSLVKSFFGIRARSGERERARRRKECIVRMRTALDKRVDPTLLPPTREVKKQTDGDKPSEASAIKDASNGDISADGQSRKEVQVFFNDRTPYRELDKFLNSIPGSETVSSSDKADITRDWRRAVERWAHEKRVREREARRALQKERRAKFRSGVERMILDGRIPIAARWKEVADQIARESFAVPEDELDARPPDLYADAQSLFEERVDRHHENFKRLIRDAKIDIQDATTVEDLQKVPSLDKLIESLDRPVVDALLADRQRKESKKRQKELRVATADFEDFLQKNEISADSTFEIAAEVWKNRTAFKYLHSVAGEDAVRKIFNEFMERRRAREEKAREHQIRLKRKFEDQNAGPKFDHEALAALERAKRIRLPSGPAPAVPIPFRATPMKEESGWEAALSSNPMTAEEKLAAKEKRKRELLQGLGPHDS